MFGSLCRNANELNHVDLPVIAADHVHVQRHTGVLSLINQIIIDYCVCTAVKIEIFEQRLFLSEYSMKALLV